MRPPRDPRGIDTPLDAQPLTLRGSIPAGGTLTLTTRPVPVGQTWAVNYLTVTASGPNVAFSWYVDDPSLPANLIDGTTDASSAVAPYNPPRRVTQGQPIVGVFEGPAGTDCTMRVEYDIGVG